MQPLTISLETILRLPAVPLEFKELLPQASGLYFAVALNHTQPVLYIGKGQNIQKRWDSHHRLRDLQVIAGIGISVNIAWLELVASDETLYQQENYLIRQFRPPLNHSVGKDPYIAQLEGKLANLQEQIHYLSQVEEKIANLEELAANTAVTSLTPSLPEELAPPLSISWQAQWETKFWEVWQAIGEGKSNYWIGGNIFDVNGGTSYTRLCERLDVVRERLTQ